MFLWFVTKRVYGERVRDNGGRIFRAIVLFLEEIIAKKHNIF